MAVFWFFVLTFLLFALLLLSVVLGLTGLGLWLRGDQENGGDMMQAAVVLAGLMMLAAALRWLITDL